jgi:glycosyltransferase involved in cell wall biosynthesis
MTKFAVAYNDLTAAGGVDRIILPVAAMLSADIVTTSFKPKLARPEYDQLPVRGGALFSDSMPTSLHSNRAFSRFLEAIRFTEGVLKFRKMSLGDYSLIFTCGEWAKHLTIRTENHPLVHYELTPPKSLYEFRGEVLPLWQRGIYQKWSRILRRLDREATARIDVLLCVSENTRKRILNFYGRDARVVYPPVDTSRFHPGKSEGFLLSVQRIDRQKRVHLQLEMLRQLPKERLVIVGSAAEPRNRLYEAELRSAAPNNVRFAGSVTEHELIDLYSRCKAVIQTGENEDFGLVPIEAAASGVPCLAPREGGFVETIIHGRTGLLINPPYIENFVQALAEFRESDFDPADCLQIAREFSLDSFVEQMKEVFAPWI